MEITSHGFLNGFQEQTLPRLPNGEGRPKHVELHGIKLFGSYRGSYQVTYLPKGLALYYTFFSLNNISVLSSHQLKKECLLGGKGKDTFYQPYEMELGSHLGGHNSDTISLATKRERLVALLHVLGFL